MVGVFFFTSMIFEGGGTTIKSCLGHIWPAAALIKMSPRSAFEEISLFLATAHILSAAVLAPLYQYTVQRHTFTSVRRYFEEGGKPNSCWSTLTLTVKETLWTSNCLVFHLLQNSIYV